MPETFHVFNTHKTVLPKKYDTNPWRVHRDPGWEYSYRMNGTWFSQEHNKGITYCDVLTSEINRLSSSFSAINFWCFSSSSLLRKPSVTCLLSDRSRGLLNSMAYVKLENKVLKLVQDVRRTQEIIDQRFTFVRKIRPMDRNEQKIMARATKANAASCWLLITIDTGAVIKHSIFKTESLVRVIFWRKITLTKWNRNLRRHCICSCRQAVSRSVDGFWRCGFRTPGRARTSTVFLYIRTICLKRGQHTKLNDPHLRFNTLNFSTCFGIRFKYGNTYRARCCCFRICNARASAWAWCSHWYPLDLPAGRTPKFCAADHISARWPEWRRQWPGICRPSHTTSSFELRDSKKEISNRDYKIGSRWG